MIDWRDIRSSEALTEFVAAFAALSPKKKAVIVEEMNKRIESVRDSEHQDWFGQTKPRQVEEPLTRRRRRTRRGR